MPLYLAFIDLTKALNLVSKNGLFKILKKIGCPPPPHTHTHTHTHLLALLLPPSTTMCTSIWYASMAPRRVVFHISSGVKQNCVLALTIFGVFFSVLLQYVFKEYNEVVLIHTRTNGQLFNIARLHTTSFGG